MDQPVYHVAQVNVSLMRAPLTDPSMAEFVAELARVNALADATEGFVWRLQTESGDATDLSPFPDPLVIMNVTVWRTMEALWEFAYRGAHAHVMKRRRTWLDKAPGPPLAIWWIEAGKIPTVEEARSKLEELGERGPSPHAFDFRRAFGPPPASQPLPDPRATTA